MLYIAKMNSKRILSYFKVNLSVLVAIFGIFAFRWCVADQYQIPSGSMEPTIHIGDRVFVKKFAYDLRIPFTRISLARVGEPARGDIIVFDNPQNGICMIKRLVGLPGEHLQIQDGSVFVNGVALDERFVQRIPEMMRHEAFDFVVPADHYFMMGDNRDNSLDSRYWGFLTREDMKGRAGAVLYNLSFDENWMPHAEWDRVGKGL